MDQIVITFVMDLLVTDEHWGAVALGAHGSAVELTNGYAIDSLFYFPAHWVQDV